MDNLRSAWVNTAGAYISINGLYPFVLGAQPHNGNLPLVRLGGHILADETGWECARREVFEESGLRIRPLVPPKTFLSSVASSAEGPAIVLEEIHWDHPSHQDAVPLLVVHYRHYEDPFLSLMYLAEADGLPVPSSEVQGLLLLDRPHIHQICCQPVTLQQYLDSGGQSILNAPFDHSLILEPFLQLRILELLL